MEKEVVVDTTDNSTSKKLSCHKTPEKKRSFTEDKENGDVRTVDQEEDYLDFRSTKRLKTVESDSSSVTPQKGKFLLECDIFKTPEKKSSAVVQSNSDKKSTPQRKQPLKEESGVAECSTSKALSLETVDEDLISEFDQAKMLIAATKNLPRPIDKTPIKDSNSQSPRRLPTNSPGTPGTPGRQRRAELITLASPKSKLLKPM